MIINDIMNNSRDNSSSNSKHERGKLKHAIPHPKLLNVSKQVDLPYVQCIITIPTAKHIHGQAKLWGTHDGQYP